MAKKLEITLVRGLAARSRREKATARSLGLRKPRQKVVREDNPCVRGMIKAISHLLEVREIEEE